MTILSATEKEPRKLEIDLRGPQGNAWYLIGLVWEFTKITGDDPKPIIEEMNSGDYENLLLVFDKHFGNFVNLYR